jgi:hypothetical protein
MEPSYLVNGRGCPVCGGTKKKTNEEFLKEVSKLENANDYTFLEKYKNDKTKIEVRHSCGHHYKVAPTHFLRGRRCPYCEKRNSYAIRTIRNILNENNIEFYQEWSPGINGVGGGPLRYDIFIPELNIIIEYDGRQHFEFAFHTDLEKFINSHTNDNIKNNYVKNTQYTLIRIPYKHNTRVKKIINNIISGKSSETIEKYNLYSINKDNEINLNNYYEEYNSNLVEYTQVGGSGKLL